MEKIKDLQLTEKQVIRQPINYQYKCEVYQQGLEVLERKIKLLKQPGKRQVEDDITVTKLEKMLEFVKTKFDPKVKECPSIEELSAQPEFEQVVKLIQLEEYGLEY